MSDQLIIEDAYADLEGLADARDAVERTIARLDKGEIRVAEKLSGTWIVNDWIKQAILLYFRMTELQTMQAGPFTYYDKIPTKSDLAGQGVRVVPPGTVRYGAFCEPGVVVMPGYVNIGAYVGAGTMVDTWATVGSCAQIGKNVHLAGGVGIGGVLEPPNARPVIIGDDAFIGSRCIVTEGAMIGDRVILGANTTLTASIPIYDMTTSEKKEYRGEVPEGAVVVQGSRPREFEGGTAYLQCAYIIGYRSDHQDQKVSLNDALRTLGVSV
jgi:2,3,4,5-tetrahydropyridine-2-carboxylate N-succinyltransferase